MYLQGHDSTTVQRLLVVSARYRRFRFHFADIIPSESIPDRKPTPDDFGVYRV
jgi:hypothetical protein